MSCKRLFNDNWYFTKQKPDTPYELFMNNDKAWEPVEVPHDWLIFDTNNLYESGDGWYRKNFNIPALNRTINIFCVLKAYIWIRPYT